MHSVIFRVLFKMLFGVFVTFISINGYSQVTTTAGASGNWSTNSNWSSGTAPTGSGTVNVNRSLTLDVGLSIGGNYTFNASCTDNCDPANTAACNNYIITGTLTVKSGTTLTLGPTTFWNNCTIYVEQGATLIIQGDLTNNNTSIDVHIDGTLQVNGNLNVQNKSNFQGSGTVNTTGAIIPSGGNPGKIFGQVVSCPTGPCSGNICVTNTLSASSTTICSGTSVTISATALGSGYTAQWQSGASSSGPFSDISGATSQNYTTTLSTTTYFRRFVTNGTCQSYSPPVGITVLTSPTVTVPSNKSVCPGTTVAAQAFTSNPSGATFTWTNNNTAIGLASTNGSGSVTGFTTTNSTTSAIAGTITVTPTLNGCTGTASSYTITVKPKPTVIVPSNITACPGTTVSATSSTPAGAGYTWTNSNTAIGLSAGGITSVPAFTTTNTGSTAISGTITVTPSLSGCTGNSSSYTITVNPTPSAPTVTSPITYCQNAASGALTATGTNLLWYTTSSGGSGSSTAITPSTASAGTTPYYVSQTNGSGCESSRSTINVVVNSSPSTPTITPSGATSFCTGCSVTLTSSAGNSYSWSSGQTTQAITVNSSGSYSVSVSNASGCSATSVATVVTVSNNCSYTWFGSVDTDWSNPANWGLCTVPALTNDVIIPSGVSNMPVISGVATCKGLTVQSGASLSIAASGTLTLAGDFANSGTVTENGTVVFAGTTSQTSTGVNSYTNLTINNSNGVALSTATTVKGILTLTSGALNSSGMLTVNLNTGAIAGTGTGSITGNITVIKSPGSVEYHFLGNPLTGSTLSWGQFSDDIYIPSGLVYAYNETVVSPDYMDGWVLPTGSLGNMKGYAIWFNAANTIDLTGPYNHTYAGNSVNVSNTASSDATADGWNLLANPYPSTIDWEASSGWTKTNIDQSIYVWDGANNRYASYVGGLGTNGGTQYIPSMQGFWVHCNVAGGTGTVAMNNNVRVTSPVLSMWKLNNENILKLSASSGKYSDETIVRLSEDGTSEFDIYLDAYKMPNDGKNPNFYSKLSGIDYSINTVTDTAQNIVIPVLLNAAFDGTYTINANNISSISDNYDVFLIDTLSHIVQNLKQNQTYTFNASVKDTADRFYIVFKNVNGSIPQATGVLGAGAGVNIGSNGKNLMVDFGSYKNNVASIQVMNVLGNEVYKNDQINTSELFNWQLSNAPEGIYVVKVIMNSGTYSGKVFLK